MISMKEWDYNLDASHDWIIYEVGSQADPACRELDSCGMNIGGSEDEGGIIGTSEWAWCDKDIVAEIVESHNKELANDDLN